MPATTPMIQDRLTELLAAKAAANEFSGVVVLQQGDRTVFSGAWGFAHRGWQIPNSLATRFRLASVSKMFTAVAVLQCIAGQKLSLDTPIVELLALQETRIPAQVHIAHLLTMTSGLADWFDESGDWEANWEALRRAQPLYLLRRNADYLPLFVNLAPLAKPGAGYHYNGAGYILLALAVEKASGLSYENYVRRHVFAPAGMDRADFIALDEVAPDLAEGYLPAEHAPGGWVKNIYQATPSAAGDGGAVAAAADLLSFSTALRRGVLLPPEWTRAMLTPQVKEDLDAYGYDWRYGYGNNFILTASGEIVRWGHTGEEDGVSCRFYHYPAQELDVVILGNQSWCAGKLGWEIHDIILTSDP